MDWSAWIKEALFGCADTVFQMLVIIIPLMIGIEFIKEYKLLDKIAPTLSPAMNFLGLPKEAVLPILAGLLFGIIYGAGLIIQAAKDGTLTHRHMTLIICFLICCHSLVEDHAIFAVQGANIALIIGLRIVIAVIVTWVLNKILPKNYKQERDVKLAESAE